MDELSYDRFNKNAKRIHRVCVDFEGGSYMVLALSMPGLTEVLLEECPEVGNVARISLPGRIPVKHEGISITGICMKAMIISIIYVK